MTSAAIDQLRKLYKQYEKETTNDFFSFLRFKSISSEATFRSEVIACADWLIDYLKGIGFEVERWETSGHPTIFAQHLKAGPHKPTLLIYNHYDVQPVDPLEEWQTPPFEPTIKAGEVYARGAQDNKGQCFYVLLALRALIDSTGSLPINIKLCIEGEEECGSSGLSKLLNEKSEPLKADYLAIVDLGIEAIDKPAITLGTRGLVTMDVEVFGTAGDLHSGVHGGLAYNPNQALVKVLASLKDDEGRITIPGFYDDVVDMSVEKRKQVSWDFDVEEYEKTFKAIPTGGEVRYSHAERNWIRPTLEINGISGGYSGQGFKTVIPAKAIAKVSCRLVPNQNPNKIGELVARHIESLAPLGTKIKVSLHAGRGEAVGTDVDSKAVKAFSQAYTEIFGKPCKYIYNGASIPIVPELAAASKADVVMLGLGLPGDAIHAPNEHFGLNRIEMGFLSIARAIQLLG